MLGGWYAARPTGVQMGSDQSRAASLNTLIAWKSRVQEAVQTKVQPKIATRIDRDRSSGTGFTFSQCLEKFRIVLRDRDDGVLLALHYGGTATVTKRIANIGR